MCDLKDIPLGDFEKRPYTDYENSTYTVISKIAFLIGVPKRIFENEHEPPQMEWYEKLYNNKNARIVRNLSILRTAIEQNFKNMALLFMSMKRSSSDLWNLRTMMPFSPFKEQVRYYNLWKRESRSWKWFGAITTRTSA